RDHLVHAPPRLEETGETRPGSAAEDPDDKAERYVHRAVQADERLADPYGEDRSNPVLALAADVEHAGAERQRERETGEDDRRRRQQRLLQVLRRDRRGVPPEPHV